MIFYCQFYSIFELKDIYTYLGVIFNLKVLLYVGDMFEATEVLNQKRGWQGTCCPE